MNAFCSYHSNQKIWSNQVISKKCGHHVQQNCIAKIKNQVVRLYFKSLKSLILHKTILATQWRNKY